MKTIMSKYGIAMMLCLSLMISSTAWAGQKNHEEVEIRGSMAFGTMIGAQQGRGDQFIGCSIIREAKSSLVSCDARDAHGEHRHCVSGNVWRYEVVVRSISAYSRISFGVQEDTKCQFISVENNSAFLP